MRKKEIEKYFYSFEIPSSLSSNKLVLKVFRAEKDIGSFKKEWKSCEILFTAD